MRFRLLSVVVAAAAFCGVVYASPVVSKSSARLVSIDAGGEEMSCPAIDDANVPHVASHSRAKRARAEYIVCTCMHDENGNIVYDENGLCVKDDCHDTDEQNYPPDCNYYYRCNYPGSSVACSYSGSFFTGCYLTTYSCGNCQ